MVVKIRRRIGALACKSPIKAPHVNSESLSIGMLLKREVVPVFWHSLLHSVLIN